MSERQFQGREALLDVLGQTLHGRRESLLVIRHDGLGLLEPVGIGLGREGVIVWRGRIYKLYYCNDGADGLSKGV